MSTSGSGEHRPVVFCYPSISDSNQTLSSYPRIRPPSFAISSESTHGVELHYRSRRAGYIGYVTGQLIEVASTFYATDLQVQVVSRDERRGVVYTVMKLSFDNTEFAVAKQLRDRVAALSDFLPVEAANFLQVRSDHQHLPA